MGIESRERSSRRREVWSVLGPLDVSSQVGLLNKNGLNCTIWPISYYVNDVVAPSISMKKA